MKGSPDCSLIIKHHSFKDVKYINRQLYSLSTIQKDQRYMLAPALRIRDEARAGGQRKHTFSCN